jgi:hypothetical protein
LKEIREVREKRKWKRSEGNNDKFSRLSSTIEIPWPMKHLRVLTQLTRTIFLLHSVPALLNHYCKLRITAVYLPHAENVEAQIPRNAIAQQQ